MADVPARPSAQQLFDEALARFAANKSKMLVDTAPDLMRVQALAAAAQVEQTARLADALERIASVVEEAHA